MSRTILISFSVLLCSALSAQQTEQTIRTGNDLYRKGEYKKAGIEFQKTPADPRAKFNYGNSLYKQNKKEEATVVFNGLSTKENGPGLRSRSYYNTGVIFSGNQKLEESIEAYKNALRINPADKEARENLQKALRELKKKTPPKKEEKKKTPQKPPPQPKLNPKQTEQQMKKLQQKEKEVREKQQQKKTGNALPKDW